MLVKSFAEASRRIGSKIAIADTASVADGARALTNSWQTMSHKVLTVNPDATSAAVIFSHGLGDTGNGWAQGFACEVAPQLPHIRFLFPTARSIPVSLNGGYRMPAWYDIESLDKNRLQMEATGIEDACAFIHALVALEAEKIKGGASRVVVGGFSQGAALSLVAGHTFPEKLGGIVALSGYLTAQKVISANWANENAATPLFMGHGRQDPVVPFELGKESFDIVKRLKGDLAPARWAEYNMEHSSCSEEMHDLVGFLNGVLPVV
jgi:phospholipase/carboxylesterase